MLKGVLILFGVVACSVLLLSSCKEEGPRKYYPEKLCIDGYKERGARGLDYFTCTSYELKCPFPLVIKTAEPDSFVCSMKDDK